MVDTPSIDPEIVSILREVASQPASVLRIPSSLAPCAFLEAARHTASHLATTSAERELLTVHRNDLARLLADECMRRAVEGSGSLLMSRSARAAAPRDRLESPMESAPRELLSAIRQREPSLEEGRPIDLLARCLAEPDSPTPTITMLAAAAFRLEPTNHARLLASIGMLVDGAYSTAAHIAREVLRFHPNDSQKMTAFDCLATASAQSGRYPDAFEYSVAAARRNDAHSEAFINSFTFALQIGQRRKALDTARQLDELIGVLPAQIDWFVSATLARRRLGQWSPSADARRLSMELAPNLGPVSGRIAHVLQ